MITQKQIDAYVKSGGAACPFCGGGSPEGQVQFEADGRSHWAMTCPECGAQWLDGYTLDSLSEDDGQEFRYIGADWRRIAAGMAKAVRGACRELRGTHRERRPHCKCKCSPGATIDALRAALDTYDNAVGGDPGENMETPS